MFRSRIRYSTTAVLGCFLALAAAAAGALAGPLYRGEILPLGDAFNLLRWAAYGGVVAAVVSLIGLIRSRPGVRRRGFVYALIGLCAGVAVFWLPYSQQQAAKRVPAIHDITTDTENPPEFLALPALRPKDANSLEYGGPDLARRQKQAYPDIQPARFDAAPDRVFDEAVSTAREMGWDIVEHDAAQGRIEAVATTFWFGFKDDVVIRIDGTPQGTRVDMRSVSRVGVSDAGKNAARIRAYIEALRERL
ncbi:MAG TPA: DUF1499 domain-containing protein [Arenicellales bacterium]|nr:DUF1499 domain-containing protein [Arenicellales bacterium]